MTSNKVFPAKMDEKVVHHTTSHSLAKTQNGKIVSSNIEDIYSVLLLCLDLKEEKSLKPGFFGLSFSNFPFSFTFQQAIEICPNLKVVVKKTNTFEACFTYNIKEKLARKLMKVFITAKLLHSPVHRTKHVLDLPCTILQPTPKGVAILQMFIKKNGIPKNPFPSILKSNFNTLELYTFERSVNNDRIYTSDLGIELLFIRCMGEKPNVWSLDNCEDEIDTYYGDDILIESHYIRSNSKIAHNERDCTKDDDFLNFQNFSFSDIQLNFDENIDDIFCDKGFSDIITESDKKGKLSLFKKLMKANKCNTEEWQTKKNQGKIISPFSHKFFNNPESDAHVQYYVSNKGLRLFQPKNIDKVEASEYFFSGKALAQWLMDCCEVFFPYEVNLFGQQFTRLGLIESIDNGHKAAQFKSGRLNLYRLTPKGNSIVCWNKGENQPLKSSHEFRYLESSISIFEKASTKTSENLNLNCPSSDYSFKSIQSHNSTVKEVKSKPTTRTNTDEEVTLVDILNDAGLRHLFRAHLEEEYCAENFDCYNSLKFFKKDMKVLRNKLLTQDKRSNNSQSDTVKMLPSTKDFHITTKIANHCLSNAYNIFGSYLVKNAPFEVNINYELKEDIADIMAHPVSPVMVSFKESILANKNKECVKSDLDNVLSDDIINNDDIYLNNVRASSVDDLHNTNERKNADSTHDSLILKGDSTVNASFGADDNLPLYLIKRNSKQKKSEDSSRISLDIPINTNNNLFSEVRVLESPTLIHKHLDILLVASKEFTEHDSMINETLFILNRIYPYFEKVSKQLYYMMETDSLHKFYENDIYKKTIQNNLF